jgi:hypothetical protein
MAGITVVPSVNQGSTVQLYVYESFGFRYSFPAGATCNTQTLNGVSPVLQPYCSVDGTGVSFSNTVGGTDGFQVPTQVSSPGEQFIIVDSSANTFSNLVKVNRGRFYQPIIATQPTFYKFETITPIDFKTYAAITGTPYSQSPALPVGLSFVSVGGSSNNFQLVGTPQVQTPINSYFIIGSNSTNGRVVTTNVTLEVQGERIIPTPLSSSITLTIGNVTSNVFTTALSPARTGTLTYYQSSPLPAGLFFANNSDIPVSLSNGFAPVDISNTVKILGTPTVAAADSMKFAGFSNMNIIAQSVTGFAGGTITTSIPVSFTFTETVLFDSYPTSISTYATVPFTSSLIKASTYFGTSAINSITSFPTLPTGLSITGSFVSGVNISGTPSNPPSIGTYAITASNTNGSNRTVSIPITIAADIVTISQGVLNLNPSVFVVSRPLTSDLSGFYASPITFSATSAIGNPINFTASIVLGNYGLTLTQVGSNATLTGIPTNTLPSTVVTFQADDLVATPATTTLTLQIVSDSFTFSPNPSLTTFAFRQNVPITPIQISATTLSERQIQSFSSLTLPTGLVISPTGLITGTLTGSSGGTFTVNASTGYSSATSLSYTFTNYPDGILFIPAIFSELIFPDTPINPVNVVAVSQSSLIVSNFVYSNLPPALPITLTPGIGNATVGGTLTLSNFDSNLGQRTTFQMKGSVQLTDGSTNIQIVSVPGPTVNSLLIYNGDAGGPILSGQQAGNNWIFKSYPPLYAVGCNAITDFQIRTPNTFSNVYIAATTDNSGNGFLIQQTDDVARSADPSNIASYAGEFPYAVANKTFFPIWFAAGYSSNIMTSAPVRFFMSINDGVTWSSNAISVPGGPFSPRFDTALGGDKGGVALKYKNGVLMIGGGDGGAAPLMFRSTTDGSSWSSVTQGFTMGEIQNFSLDSSTIWVATGSSMYRLGQVPSSYIMDANTLQYSSNSGTTWAIGSNQFNYMGLDVQYGSNDWLATGITFGGGGYVQDIKYSIDAINWVNIGWTTITGSNVAFYLEGTPATFKSTIGPMNFDGSNWTLFVTEYSGPGQYNTSRFSHPPFPTGSWTRLPDEGVSTAFRTDVNPELAFLKAPITIRNGSDPETFLTFPDFLATQGPTFTSPTITAYTFIQYIPITPITFQASGIAGPVVLFVNAVDVPVGMNFDATTGILSGTPMFILNGHSLNIYAKDQLGVTIITLLITVRTPFRIAKQSGAGAYTALVRQDTLINATQNARDNVVYPSRDTTLGALMSPAGKDVVSPAVCQVCFKANCGTC